MNGTELERKKGDLIRWKTDAWKDPAMVAFYSKQMVENTGTTRLKNLVETNLCARFAQGEKILDVGVGTGRASLPLARKGYKVTGVDSSQAMLDECRRLAAGTPIDLKQGDVLNLPVEDESFDTVMALNVVTHFPNWRDILRAWGKKVRPGGRVMFDIYSLDHLQHLSGRTMSEEELIAANDFGHYNTHIKVEDLVACADALGFRIVAVVPYGGLFSGRHQYYFSGQFLNDQHWWQRHMSWMASDDAFFDFCLFLEERFFGAMSSQITGRFFLVVEKQPDPAANKSWLNNYRRFNELLSQGLTEELLAAAMPGQDVESWKQALNSHLDGMRSRAVFFFLWMSIWGREDVFNTPILASRHREALEKWKDGELKDRNAFGVAQSWHKQANIADILDFHGVPLGLGTEYEMTRILLRDCYHAFE